MQRLEFLDLQVNLKEESAHPTEIVKIYEAANAAEGKYKVGDRVVHAKFGSGIVAGVEGNILTVTFDTGKKRIIDDFVERQ